MEGVWVCMTDWLVVVNQSYNCFRVFFPFLFFSFLTLSSPSPSFPVVVVMVVRIARWGEWAISSPHEHPCLGSVASYHPANRPAYCGKWLEVMSFFTLKSRARGPLEAHKSWEGPCSRSTSNLIKTSLYFNGSQALNAKCKWQCALEAGVVWPNTVEV